MYIQLISQGVKMAKISKLFRLSDEAIAILESKPNASRFVEDLILKGGEGISRGEAMILDRLEKLELQNKSAPEIAAITGQALHIPPINVLPPCCFGKSPCKHWAYDGLKEAYVNSISGEIKDI
jgi:hypothetical protein